MYRWAYQALATPPDHPLLPLVWQRFLQLYLRQPGPEYGYAQLLLSVIATHVIASQSMVTVKKNDIMSPCLRYPLGWLQVDVLAEGFSKPLLRLLFSESLDREYRRFLTFTILPARLSGYLHHTHLHQAAREMQVLTVFSSLT